MMKQKIDKSDAKTVNFDGFIDCFCWLLLIGAPAVFFIGLALTACEQEKIKTQKPVPAEQRQPMIEIPIERTVCVKPAEGYCMEYRTNRIRTP
jgi:hypothetical protein